MSTPARLLDMNGRPLDASNRTLVPTRNGAILYGGVDENEAARISRTESYFRAQVQMAIGTFANRFDPRTESNQANLQRATTRRTSFVDTTNLSTPNGLVVDSTGLFTPATSLTLLGTTNDIPGGIGAWSLCMTYWAVDGRLYTKTIVPNGTTAVNLLFDPAVFFIDRLYVTAVGSLGTADDIQILYTDGVFPPYNFEIVAGTSLQEHNIASTGGMSISGCLVGGIATSTDGLSYSVFDYTTVGVPVINLPQIYYQIFRIDMNSLPQYIRFDPPIYIPPSAPGTINLLYQLNPRVRDVLLEPLP